MERARCRGSVRVIACSLERDIVDEILAHRHKKQQTPLPYPATPDATASGNTRDIAPARRQETGVTTIRSARTPLDSQMARTT
jgi:hypothetical protein